MGPLLVALAAAAALAAVTPWLLRRLIRTRLQGYRVAVTTPDPAQPLKLDAPRPVAVLGAGVAGVTAALTLARRGYQVTLFEKQSYLGGKLGSWPVQLGPEQQFVSHGFHAFFRHYYNLNRVLDSLGARPFFRSIGDYVIVGRDGSQTGFAGLATTPVFNLLSMWWRGEFTLRDVLKAPVRDVMGVFLEYSQADTFRRYDRLSFADFDRIARLPKSLKRAFNTFARAFFSDEDKLSLAELIKSFHFYYLSNDAGLIYDVPTADYETCFWAPVRAELLRLGATVRLSTPVSSLQKTADGFTVNGERFEQVVVATDVVGANAIVGHATGLPEPLTARFKALRPGQRYAVLRVWADKDVRPGLNCFVITERERVLDAYTAYHRLERESADWVKRHGGAVHEMHCYAVPEDLPDAEVRAALISEVQALFPELTGWVIAHEHFQLRRDFTAFHVGLDTNRPGVDTGVKGLVCAGDWVKLPFPAMLLEAAAASGLVAANRVLALDGLREELVESVPLEGLLAHAPRPPGRVKVLPEAG